MITFSIISLTICCIMIGSPIMNPILPKWFCIHLGQHLEPKEMGFDGCSFKGTCPRCGKRVLQDSQGNWF